MKTQIKNMRVRIDGLAKMLKTLVETVTVDNSIVHTVYRPDKKTYHVSHELQKSHDDLILAKAWLGKVLEFLGTESPYKNDGKRKTAADIEPTADTAQFRPEVDTDWVGLPTAWWQDATHIEKIDWLRERIKGLIEDQKIDLDDFDNLADPSTNEILSCLNKHVHHLHEARFWLGFELQRIRESNS